MGWRDLAACFGMDTEIWYRKPDRDRARGICRACPVRVECLEDALRMENGVLRDSYGIRAGLLPAQRQKLIRRRRASRSPAG